jgi:hypothetical protein
MMTEKARITKEIAIETIVQAVASQPRHFDAYLSGYCPPVSVGPRTECPTVRLFITTVNGLIINARSVSW